MRPAILCKLEKGKVLDANPGFVDTFNWLVDFCNNLCGDKDKDDSKSITLDKTVDDRPVICFKGTAVGGGEIEIVGNDSGPTTVTCKTGRITFASAPNSNLVFTPSVDLDGNVTITVGAYYVGPAPST